MSDVVPSKVKADYFVGHVSRVLGVEGPISPPLPVTPRFHVLGTADSAVILTEDGQLIEVT